MNTTSLTIQLSESSRAYVEQQVAAGKFGSVDAYIESLIQIDRKRREQEKLTTLLLEAYEGERTEVNQEWWDRFHIQLRKSHNG